MGMIINPYAFGPPPGKSFSFNGSSARIELASAVVSAAPCTMVAWFKSAGTVNTQSPYLVSIGGTTARLAMGDNVTSVDVIAAESVNTASTTRRASEPSGYTNGSWQHHAAVFASLTSRTGYLNGTAGTTDTVNNAPSGMTKTTIGARYSAGAFGPSFANGNIAYVAIWNIALSGAEIASLATPGTLPSSIQAANLVFYADLQNGLAVDSISATSLTVTAAVSSTDGPF